MSNNSSDAQLLIPGMTVRDFRGFHNIQEVECWGGHLEAEMNILSLKLYELTNHTLLGYLNHQTRECFTFMEFSSCLMDPADTRRSRLRVLVSDLDEGDTRHFGCDVTSWKAFGSTNTVSLSVSVTVNGELLVTTISFYSDLYPFFKHLQY